MTHEEIIKKQHQTRNKRKAAERKWKAARKAQNPKAQLDQAAIRESLARSRAARTARRAEERRIKREVAAAHKVSEGLPKEGGE